MDTNDAAATQLERLYTVEEVMEALRVSRWTVYRWHREGIMPAVRAPQSRRLLFTERQVIAARSTAA